MKARLPAMARIPGAGSSGGYKKGKRIAEGGNTYPCFFLFSSGTRAFVMFPEAG